MRICVSTLKTLQATAATTGALLALAAGQVGASEVAIVRLAAASISATDLDVGTLATVSITDNAGAPTALPYDVVVAVTGAAAPVTITVPAGTSSVSVPLAVPPVAAGSTILVEGFFAGDAGVGTVAASLTISAAIAADG